MLILYIKYGWYEFWNYYIVVVDICMDMFCWKSYKIGFKFKLLWFVEIWNFNLKCFDKIKILIFKKKYFFIKIDKVLK